MELTDPRTEDRWLEASWIAQQVNQLISGLVSETADDTRERLLLIEAVVWIVCGTWLMSWATPQERQVEWERARELVMEIARRPGESEGVH